MLFPHAPLQPGLKGQMIFFHTEVKNNTVSRSLALTPRRQTPHDTGVQFQYTVTANVGSSNIVGVRTTGTYSSVHYISLPFVTSSFQVCGAANMSIQRIHWYCDCTESPAVGRLDSVHLNLI